MPLNRRLWRDCAFGLADEYLQTIRNVRDWSEMRRAMVGFTDELGFRHYALLTHEDLSAPGPGKVDLLDYPEGAVDRIIGGKRYRRDPVMRGCIFAEGAFLWSEMRQFMTIDHHDRIALDLGLREGLDEGITVPCSKLGQCLGSCTFAGLKAARTADHVRGPAQMIGIFAFQRARQLAGPPLALAPLPRLEPRYRDCIILAGQGFKNKVIAHRLGLTHRTVESYLRDARRLFSAGDTTELVAAAVLAGEIDLYELRRRQAP